MKLKKGTTVYIGGKVFKGEVPDELLPKTVKEVSGDKSKGQPNKKDK